MPVKVKCTNCEKVLSAPDAARGKAIRCPECQTKVAVPAEDSGSSSKSGSKSKAKKASKPVDSESALATFDMRRAADNEARVCPKCGHDMQYQDEDDNECPKCGYDASEGGMGARARKRAMKGPDPADFYPGLFKQSWKFVGKNILLAWRTVVYTLVCLSIALGCAFLYLWISPWPPRWFMALCFTISFLVIPGWMWYLDTEVIKLTLERKDKFRKLNFDFFLASAMGAAFVFWSVAVAVPLMALPTGFGYYLVKYQGSPNFVLPICMAIGAIPAIWMLPVVMSHMSMPVQYPGWLIWKVVPIAFKNFKPLTAWFLLFIATNILNIAGIVVIAALFGNNIETIVNRMEYNAEIRRAKAELVENPNAARKGKKAPSEAEVQKRKDLEEKAKQEFLAVDFFPLIVPAVILVVMCLANGFTSMFNMRTNGQFTWYNKNSLELVERAKEYKYVAKERRGEDDEDEVPKTTSQLLVDAIAFVLIIDIMGLISGMVRGSLGTAGPVLGLIQGLFWAHFVVAFLAVYFQCIKAGFSDSAKWGFINIIPFGVFAFIFQDWQQRKGLFLKIVVWFVTAIIVFVTLILVGVALVLTFMQQQEAAPAVDPAAQQNQMQNQMMMPNQMMQPGPAGQQAPTAPTTPAPTQ